MDGSERKAHGTIKLTFEDALDSTGFGKYNVLMLATCCLLILAMYVDIFGISVVLPSVACDMGLSTWQQGILTAVPLIGVMISSYAWGLCADTLGRRTALMIAMPVGAVLNLVTSMAPTFTSLALLKFLSGAFTASANAAAYVLQGESVPSRHRSRFMFLMASTTMVAQCFIASLALPIFRYTFNINIGWLSLDYRPWRLLLQVVSIPGILGVVGLLFLKESPKFLLSKGRDKEAMEVLKSLYHRNTGFNRDAYSITSVHLDESIQPVDPGKSFARRMWDQTVPLFKPPLLKNSLILYYMLLCAYMTSTGYTMWVPSVTNAYFSGDDTTGKTFCDVASTAARGTTNSINTTAAVECDSAVKARALLATMAYSGGGFVLNVLLSFLVAPLGQRASTLLVFCVSILGGLLLLFVRIPIISIGLFFTFLYVSLILGNVNTYLVDLNPTYLRGMATCLSVVVARGLGFFSVQLIAGLLADHCTPMVSGYIALVTSGLVVAIFLPPDKKQDDQIAKNSQIEIKIAETEKTPI